MTGVPLSFQFWPLALLLFTIQEPMLHFLKENGKWMDDLFAQ